MRQRLVIHIGMHKTGSSSIQRCLSRNRWALRRLGVYYPPSIGPDGERQPKHNALFTAISHEADFGAPHPALGPSARMVASLADRIEAAGAPTTILSAEGFSGERPVFAQALAPLADRFDCTVVAFLRRPDDWVESFYKQMVLSREVRESRSMEAFVDCERTRAHLDYARILSWWADRFGDRALRVARFPPPDDAPLFETFRKAAVLGPVFGFLPYSRARENRSPPWPVVEARRLENASRAPRDLSVDPASPDGPGAAALAESRREEILETTLSGVREIERRYPLVHSGPLFEFSRK